MGGFAQEKFTIEVEGDVLRDVLIEHLHRRDLYFVGCELTPRDRIELRLGTNEEHAARWLREALEAGLDGCVRVTVEPCHIRKLVKAKLDETVELQCSRTTGVFVPTEKKDE